MSNLGKLKQSDTFRADVALLDEGTAYPITGATVTSKVRNRVSGVTIALSVTITDAALGKFTVSGDTTTWQVGNYDWDVRLDEGGFSWSMPTTLLEIEERLS